jgi:MFS family permease
MRKRMEAGQQDEAVEVPEKDPTLVFGAASFLNDTGSDMIAPIWPTFLTDVLSLNLFQVGFVDGLALTITALSKMGAGYASDRTGKRKRFITLGYFMSMMSRIGFVISYSFFHIVFWKSMDRLGKMRGPPRDAIVADHATDEERGRAFGILRAMDTAGAVTGSIITFVLFVYLTSLFADATMVYMVIILIAVIPSIGSVIVVSAFIKEKRGRDVFKGVSFRGLDRNLKLFLLASVFFAFATMSYSFLILFSRDFGYSDIQLPLLYILFTFTYAASAYPFGTASDRFGRKPILLLAFLLLIMTALWAHVIVDMFTVLPLFILFGLTNGALDPVQTSLVADLVEEERRASIIGAFQTAIGLTALPSGMVIGYLWDVFGALVAFQFSLVLALVATVILLLVRTKQN